MHATSPGVDTDTTLTTEEVKTRLIDPFSDMGGSIFHFTGGDPFLRKDLPELIDHAIKRRLAVSVDTNGLVMTQPRKRDLFERVIPKLVRAGIPIDAPNAALQIAMRGHRLAYRAPLRFLEIAQEVRPRFQSFPEIKVNTLATGLTYQRIPEMVDILEPFIIGTKTPGLPGVISRWSIDKFLPMERGAANESQYALDEDIYRETIARARRELAARGIGDIITGDQVKRNTTLIVSPQGVAYVPNGIEKQFVPLSVRDTALSHIVGQTALVGHDEQYVSNTAETSGSGLYRHPEWEAFLLTRPILPE